jgi:hypothetical protein
MSHLLYSRNSPDEPEFEANGRHLEIAEISNWDTLMIADKDLLHMKWPADSDRRQRHLYDGYAVQEAGLKRRSTISHPRVEPHDLASFGAASVYLASVKGS